MAAIVAAAFLPESPPTAVRVAGVPLLAAGALVVGLAARELGRSLTPLPEPPRDAVLVQTGPYRVVRHPIYAGGIVFCLGFGALTGAVPSGLTVALAVLWAFKAREEERRLVHRFPAYEEYRRRTRRLLFPGLY